MTVLPLGGGCAPETPAVVCIVRLGSGRCCQRHDNERVHSLAMRSRRGLAQVQAGAKGAGEFRGVVRVREQVDGVGVGEKDSAVALTTWKRRSQSPCAVIRVGREPDIA